MSSTKPYMNCYARLACGEVIGPMHRLRLFYRGMPFGLKQLYDFDFWACPQIKGGWDNDGKWIHFPEGNAHAFSGTNMPKAIVWPDTVDEEARIVEVYDHNPLTRI